MIMQNRRFMKLAACGAAALLAAGVPGARGEPNVLEETSATLSRIVEAVMPAVVSIRVERTVTLGGGGGQPSLNDPFEFFDDDFLRRFFRGGAHPRGGRPQAPREFRQEGAGSGFLISEDGYILSNNHVVGDADTIVVRLHDGREFDAERIGTDPKSEVALIKIDGKNFPTLPLGDSSRIRVGEYVVAVGNPFGLSETVTSGIVSAKGRSNIGIADYEDFIQTDAAINPGNSGGPLVNVAGKAIGINTAIYSRSGGYMGIGFAIPIDMARYVKNQLIEKGEVVRSYLGVYIQEVTRELAESFGLAEAAGVLVSRVGEDTGAEEGGLKAGDIILELDGEDVASVGAFRNDVSVNPPGTELTLTVFRDGRISTIDVITGAFPAAGEPVPAAEEPAAAEKLGLTVQNLTEPLAQRFGYEGEEGVLVSDVEFGGAAAQAGLQAGNLIASVNRVPVANVEEFEEALALSEKSRRVLLLVSTPRGSRFVVVNME